MDDGGLPDVEDLGSDEVGEGEVHSVAQLPGAQAHRLEGGPEPLVHGDALALLGGEEWVEAHDVLERGHLDVGVHRGDPGEEHRAAE